jgi:hypothetical protein
MTKGESIPFTFSWNTTGTNIGSHTLMASHDFIDDISANNSASTTVKIISTAEPTSVHIADLDGKGTNLFGGIWVARVTVSVKNNMEEPVLNATVSGTFSDGPTVFQCITNEGSTCFVEGGKCGLTA